MAFVVVLFRGEEVTRRELSGPVVIGRSPECDISVRDILLSRRHCKLAPVSGAKTWAVEDLGSKNGTRIGGEAVQYTVLHDGASVRIGKTQVKFYTGSLKPAPVGRKPSPPKRRPADPFEALSGTVAAFEFVPEGPTRDLSRLPTPLPHPADPRGYANDGVYNMISEIASSSWDSIYATASEPAAVMVAGQKQRPLPVAGVKVAGADLPPRRRNVVTDASLQVDHDGAAHVAVPSDPELAVPSTADAAPPAPARDANAIRSRIGAIVGGVKYVLTGRFLRRAV
jgi:hypothetical protein